MRSTAPILISSLALLLAGCPTDGNGDPIFQNGADVPERAADEEWSGDLDEGSTIDLDWATGGLGCFPGTESVNWSGNWVFYERTLGADTDGWVRANPDPATDVSVLVIKAGASTTEFPPDLTSGVSCDTSYDRENDGNPGVSEAVKVLGGNEYRLVIGVAGANDQTSGAYDVQLWLGE